MIYCLHHPEAVNWNKYRLPTEEGQMDVSTEERDRFYAMVSDPTPGKCWAWGGYLNKDGYGLFRCDGQMRLAHRVAFTIAWGEIPEGKYVMHRCDRPSCVNPDHLTYGTQADNMGDAKAKRRHAHGETHAKAKLTEAKVERMRTLWATGLVKQTELARLFDISPITVHFVVAGKTWALADGKITPPKKAKKISAEQVDEIRQLLLDGTLSQKEIGERYGIKQPHVSRIKRGESRAV